MEKIFDQWVISLEYCALMLSMFLQGVERLAVRDRNVGHDSDVGHFVSKSPARAAMSKVGEIASCRLEYRDNPIVRLAAPSAMSIAVVERNVYVLAQNAKARLSLRAPSRGCTIGFDATLAVARRPQRKPFAASMHQRADLYATCLEEPAARQDTTTN
jgi:hypothetical protein